MKYPKRSRICVLLTALLLFTLPSVTTLSLLSFESTAEGSGDYPPPTQEDWIVTSDTYIKSENLTVDRNITIKNGAKLTLDDTTLVINTSNYGGVRITVNPGGELCIINNSVLMQGETGVNYDFEFENESTGLIQDSTIRDCGWDDEETYQSTGGIFIASDDVIIENSTIQNNYIGIVIYYSSPVIKNNILLDNLRYGIFVISNKSIQLTGNDITNSPVGMSSFYSNLTLIDNDIHDNGDGVRLYSSTVDIEGGSIVSNSRDDCTTGTCSGTETGLGIYVSQSDLVMSEVQISENDGMGLISYDSEIDVQNSTFRDNLNGLVGEYSSGNLLNNAFSNNTEYGILWKYTALDVHDSNTFTQNNGLGRIRMEWMVRGRITDSYGEKVSNAHISFEGKWEEGALSDTITLDYQTDSQGYWNGGIPGYIIDNSGTYIDYNPYNFTASKIASWDEVQYTNSTQIEITENTDKDMSIPLLKPDLKMGNITFSDTPRVGKKVNIKVKISNIGDALANDVEVIVTQKDSLGKTVIVESTTISINPSESLELPISWVPEREGEAVIVAKAQTSYDEKNRDKENNEFEIVINVGEKERSLFESPYILAALVSIILILAGVGGYFIGLRKKKGAE